MMRPTLLFASALLLASSTTAQIRPGDVGFMLVTKSGNAGTLCRGFSCTPHATTITRGETVTLSVRGPMGAPYVVLLSPRAPVSGFCLTVPGLKNSLILPAPIFPLHASALNTRDRILACPGGLDVVTAKIPATLGVGQKLTLQGLVLAQWTTAKFPTFTPAIALTTK